MERRMKKIGCFRKDRHDFYGTVTLMQADIKARIAPVRHKSSPQSPDFMITKVGSDGFSGELGGAWNKYSVEQRVPYLDVVLDNPSLQHSINAVLCEGHDDLWYLYWDRLNAGEEMIQILIVQEELKPQIGIRPIANYSLNILKFYPELVEG
jgi:uncharacterized protein (DUF736 family)